MKKTIKEKSGKYKLKKEITLRDILLVLTIVGLICLTAIICEV